MPELEEQVYCSEQIFIPPTFPFLLKQYAKAAIRSQPTDLLQWSTSYFRCLSLNIPPPVKPRLEYPIVKDYCSITPGWLKALLHQLQNTHALPFKVLWDRWTGACLDHKIMIRILCLGKFDNPNSIPWIKFLGLCAAHLTEDLTHTMILICEILTEEPEGGSAMIPLKVFLDLYVFLAKTDASKPQILKNIQFTEAEINIWKEKVGETAIDRPPVEIEQHGGNISTYIRNNISLESIEKSDQSLDTSRQSEGNEMEDQGRRVSTKQKGSSHDKTAEPSESMSKAVANCEINQEQNQTSEAKGRECVVSAEKSGSNIQEGQVTNKESVSLDIDDVMKNGSICLKGIAQTSDESAGSVDNSVTSDVKRIFHENIPIDDPVNKMEDNTNGKISEENEVISHSEPFSYGEIHIDAIPGIGPPVPDELIQAVCEYMEKVAATQRGMVMPRNIRNYNCPPLEVLDY